jgi:hypothetical protein
MILIKWMHRCMMRASCMPRKQTAEQWGFYHKLMIVILDVIITSIRNDRFTYVEVGGLKM